MLSMNKKQMAIIKKDLKGIIFDKQQFPVLLIVPAVFTLVLPTIFILLIHFGQDSMTDMQDLLNQLSLGTQETIDSMFMIKAILDYVMPIFFLLIPIMSAMVMAASSFVGEKENRTLETLLYSPLTIRMIFQAKILASFLLSMIISLGSFIVMLIVIELETFFLIGSFYVPGLSWLVNLFLLSPAISGIAITLIVRGSAKAQTAQESQQRAVFLILPIILLVAGQFSGIVLVGPLLLLGLGVVLAAVAVFLMRGSIQKFSYERLL